MSALLDDILEHGLLHGADYDPVKAREYYLRTRELKGRQKGAQESSNSIPRGSREATPSNRGPAKAKPKAPVKKAVSPALQRRRDTQERIDQINARLDALREVLRKLVEQAKTRSGVDPKTVPSKSATKKATSAGSEKLTAAQKKEAAKKAKERYEKDHGKKESLTSQEKALQAQVKDVQKKIAKARKDLAASIERAKKKQAAKNPAAASRRNS